MSPVQIHQCVHVRFSGQHLQNGQDRDERTVYHGIRGTQVIVNLQSKRQSQEVIFFNPPVLFSGVLWAFPWPLSLSTMCGTGE